MYFESRPHNDFAEFIETYFERCRAACPGLRGIAGKWAFEDLIPGLSDFDARFLVADDTTAEDWIAISIAVGKVHADLAREKPEWARILEHLPGYNLSLSELLDPLYYSPDYRQWTWYRGPEAGLASLSDYLSRKAWSALDELYHLKRFAAYYGPYLRGIDPPVNMGKWENKYPLHSRFMHYFAPPVQSAVSIARRRGFVGKLDTLREARSFFPHPEVIDMVFQALECHYEIPEYHNEPELSRIERTLETYLKDTYKALESRVTLIEIREEDTPDDVRAGVASIAVSAAERFYEMARGCRLMKGRLLFYAEDIPHFDTTWLIPIELGRVGKSYYDRTLIAYGEARFGEILPPWEVLERVSGTTLTAEDCRGWEEFARRTSLTPSASDMKKQARAVSESFDSVLRGIEKLHLDLRKYP